MNFIITTTAGMIVGKANAASWQEAAQMLSIEGLVATGRRNNGTVARSAEHEVGSVNGDLFRRAVVGRWLEDV